jgi:hypothetical protein
VLHLLLLRQQRMKTCLRRQLLHWRQQVLRQFVLLRAWEVLASGNGACPACGAAGDEK